MKRTYSHVENNQLTPDEKRELWNAAFAIQSTSGKEPSKYMRKLVEKHINGEISYVELTKRLEKHYK